LWNEEEVVKSWWKECETNGRVEERERR